MLMKQILLLEDDISLVDGLAYYLNNNGYQLTIAAAIKEAEALIGQNPYDLLLLDVTLPDGNSFHLCEKIRKQGNQVPIIFLTASDDEVNIIRGLDCGGDDYITKPFKLGELNSRINALLRRSTSASKAPLTTLTKGNITIDFIGNRIYLNEMPLELTNAEYRLLCYFVRNANQILTRKMILDELWDGSGDFVDDNTLSVYIRRLREKTEKNPSQPDHLITVRGFGYEWKENIQ